MLVLAPVSSLMQRLGTSVRLALCGIVLLAATGCKMIAPSNARNWQPDQTQLAYAIYQGDHIQVHNIRNCKYLSTEEYVLDYYDKTIDLRKLKTVDFIVCPFDNMPQLAHTMLSFGFEDGYHLCLSVEIRREEGESYAAWKGSLRQYELMYVLGDERDLIQLRTNHRGEAVYLYRSRATPEQAQALFVDVMDRVNKLYREPEFYDTLTNNCTTNLVRHINRLQPHRVPYNYQVLLPGHSDRLAYNLGLLDTTVSFDETKRQAYINPRAQQFAEHPDFSTLIRR